MNMQTYIVQRTLLAILTVFIVSTVVFFMMRVIPGDAAFIHLQDAGHITPEQIRQVKEAMGLNDNVIVQYINWYKDVFTGDFGISYVTREPVIDGLIASIPVTLELVIFAWTLSLVIGVSIGALSALKPNTPIDYVARLLAIIGLSVPQFVLATLVVLILAFQFNWLPPVGYHSLLEEPWGNIQQYFIPAILLGVSTSAGKMRLTRSALLEVIRQDYIRTARAKGLAESSILIRHALKNALAPVFTVAGSQLAALIGGTVVIELIFTMPGVGTWTLQAINSRDYPVVQTSALFLTSVLVFMNIFVDLSLKWLDPRIKY